MSSTTTQTRTARTVLRDYELHHSPAPNVPSTPSNENRAHERFDSPPWETTYRRVPPYRPVDTNRDQSQIRVYTSNIERVFIVTMFTGVFINATVAKAWHATFGSINDRIFKYQVGGEY